MAILFTTEKVMPKIYFLHMLSALSIEKGIFVCAYYFILYMKGYLIC